MNILVGADPEVFVKQQGKFVSAHGLIPGNKKNPFAVDKGAVQVDGMALEFNIDPSATEDQFCLNIQSVYDTLKGMVPGYDVYAVPVADFPLAYIKAQPEEATELGCDPDFNGWTLTVNPRPSGDRPMRTASGHVHIGWTQDQQITCQHHMEACGDIVQQLDFFLGLPSLMYDMDSRRREMYGMAGAFRPKSYGVEYRTLSNAWLNSEKLIRWVFRNTQRAMKEFAEGNILVNKYGDIQEVINSSNRKVAMEIIKEANLEVAYG